MVVGVVLGVAIIALIERSHAAHKRGRSGRLRRGMKRVRWTIITLWVIAPLTFLGAVCAVIFPLAMLHAVGRSFAWYVYGAALLSATGSAYWTRRKYRTTLLERSERGVVYWVRERDDQKDAPTAPSAVGPIAKP